MKIRATNKSTRTTNDSTLSETRILQKNLLYVIGLPSEILQYRKELGSDQLFGIYGKVQSVLVSKEGANQSRGRGTVSLFVTYQDELSTEFAILALNKFKINNKQLRASYGRTRYCFYFLNQEKCKNQECNYLHAFVNPSLSCMSGSKQKQLRIKPKQILSRIINESLDITL